MALHVIIAVLAFMRHKNRVRKFANLRDILFQKYDKLTLRVVKVLTKEKIEEIKNMKKMTSLG